MISFKQFYLTELFNNPYPFHMDRSGRHATFQTKSGRKIGAVVFPSTLHGKKSHSIMFGFPASDGTLSFSATDERDSFRVFATIIEWLKQVYRNSSDLPDKIDFSASKVYGNSRARLYKKMADMLVQQIRRMGATAELVVKSHSQSELFIVNIDRPVTEQLEEGYNTPVLFHKTDLHNLVGILQKNQFRLSSSMGTGSEKEINGSSNYYLSTSRTPLNRYTKVLYGSAVILVLDQQKMRQRHKMKPADYWQWGAADREKEAEERVMSGSATISADYIKEIHILIEPENLDKPKYKNIFLTAVKLAKRRNSALFFYTDRQAFRILNKGKTVPLKSLLDKFRYVNSNKPWGRGKRSNFFAPWFELYHKKDEKELSKTAGSLKYELRYGGDYRKSEMVTRLKSDIHNESRPASENVVRLTNIMRKHKLKTPEEFIDFLAKKWERKEE